MGCVIPFLKMKCPIEVFTEVTNTCDKNKVRHIGCQAWKLKIFSTFYSKSAFLMIGKGCCLIIKVNHRVYNFIINFQQMYMVELGWLLEFFRKVIGLQVYILDYAVLALFPVSYFQILLDFVSIWLFHSVYTQHI